MLSLEKVSKVSEIVWILSLNFNEHVAPLCCCLSYNAVREREKDVTDVNLIQNCQRLQVSKSSKTFFKFTCQSVYGTIKLKIDQLNY